MNPADLYRNDSSSTTLNNGSDTAAAGFPSNDAASLTAAAINAKKAAAQVQRIDTEIIYTRLKAAIGDGWEDYKEAIGNFLLGKIGQNELTKVLSLLLNSVPVPPPSSTTTSQQSDPFNQRTSILHLHNTLIAAIYANALYRDAPTEQVASWVLSTDSPSLHGGAKNSSGTGAGGGAGNQVEERIKREVMGLSGRDRRRIKAVRDASGHPTTVAADPHIMGRYESGLGLQEAVHYHDLLESGSQAVMPGSGATSTTTGKSQASALAKTNFDIEIKRRFALQMASESLEFPSKADIQARLEPICYEQGLVGGVSTATALQACAELVETAAEMFIKEQLENWFAVIRADSQGLVQTAKFKTRLRREEMLEEEQAAAYAVQAAAEATAAADAAEQNQATMTDQNTSAEGPPLDREAALSQAPTQSQDPTAHAHPPHRHHAPGDIIRNKMGLLPVEVESVASRDPLALEEVRLVLQLDENRLRLDPFLAQEILTNGWMEDVLSGQGDSPLPSTMTTAAGGGGSAAAAAAAGTNGSIATGNKKSNSNGSTNRLSDTTLSSPQKRDPTALGLSHLSNGTTGLSTSGSSLVKSPSRIDADADIELPDAAAIGVVASHSASNNGGGEERGTDAMNGHEKHDGSNTHEHDESMDWGWTGGSSVSRGGVMEMLNGVLAVGS